MAKNIGKIMNCKRKRLKPKLLFIAKEQFGYLTDLYKWCECLRVHYNITVISPSGSDKKKYELEGVKVKYVPFGKSRRMNAVKFISTILWHCAFTSAKVFVVYYESCSLLKLVLKWRKMHVDVRTLTVSKDSAERKRLDNLLIRECSKFDSCSAISEGVARRMGLPGVQIVPLGSDVISGAHKEYNKNLRLLYVGTFDNRNIEQTVEGVKLFRDEHPDVVISYHIVGKGQKNEAELIQSCIDKFSLNDCVHIHGYMTHEELLPLYNESNIGVSYVPITEYYQHQPPTKTYEYVLSGLYCIATATESNKSLITKDNGFLIVDNPQGFKFGCESYLNCCSMLKEVNIRKSLANHNWKNIVDTYLKPIL